MRNQPSEREDAQITIKRCGCAYPKRSSAVNSFPVNKPFMGPAFNIEQNIFQSTVMYNYIADIKHEQIPSQRNEFGPVPVIPFPC